MSDKKYGVTERGFVMKRLDEIYGDICAALKAEIGVDPSENPQGIFNVIVTICADEIAKLWESFGAAYMQLFPLTADGVALDNLMEIGGVWRLGKSRTEYLIACTGKEGTILPAGALIRSNTSPSRQFRCRDISTISAKNWQTLRIRPISNISGTFTLEFGIERNAASGAVGDYSSGTTLSKSISSTSYEDAYEKILTALQGFEALERLGITVASEVNDDGSSDIVLTGSKAADSFSSTFCSYITLASVTSTVWFESVEFGNVPLANGTITEIVTSIDGLDAVTNLVEPSAGRLAQTDAEVRTAYLERVANRGKSTVESICSLLYSDAGVTFAKGVQNDSDAEDSAGLPPHSLSITVQGGSDEDIANIIWNNKAPGIRAYGSHYAYATDGNGDKHYVEFVRVTTVYLVLSVKITSVEGNLDDDYISRVQALLSNQNLTVGKTIRLQSFIQPILSNLSGADYVEIKGKLSSDPDISDVPEEELLAGIVPVESYQQPVISANGIKVVSAT